MKTQIVNSPEEKNWPYPGCAWDPIGQSAYSGSILRLYKKLDNLFLKWSKDNGAEDYLFPSFVKVSELNKVEYFHSFPHLLTIPVTLKTEEGNIERFSRNPLDEKGRLKLGEIDDPEAVLTPAACYHFYVHFKGSDFRSPCYLTTHCTCYRREAYYSPLQRQWCFTQRELVCIGTEEEVISFVSSNKDRVSYFLKSIGLSATFEKASDPFFQPTKNPKFIYQRLHPVKTEIIFDGSLAIGSFNFHRTLIGEAFDLKRDGKVAFSGCIGFGIERWIHAWIKTYGPEESGWPELPA